MIAPEQRREIREMAQFAKDELPSQRVAPFWRWGGTICIRPDFLLELLDEFDLERQRAINAETALIKSRREAGQI